MSGASDGSVMCLVGWDSACTVVFDSDAAVADVAAGDSECCDFGSGVSVCPEAGEELAGAGCD